MFDRSAAFQTGPENRWECSVFVVAVVGSSPSAEYMCDVRCAMWVTSNAWTISFTSNTAHWNSSNGPQTTTIQCIHVYNYRHNLCFIDCMFDSTGSMLANLERIKYDQFIVILIVFYALYKLLTVDAKEKWNSLSHFEIKRKKKKYQIQTAEYVTEPERNIHFISHHWMDGRLDSVLSHSFMLLLINFFSWVFAACCAFMLSRIQTSEPN